VFFQSNIKAMMYVRKAGTVILFAVLLIWVVSNYPRNSALDRALEKQVAAIEMSDAPVEEKQAAITKAGDSINASQLEYSIAGRVGKLMEPVIRPLGFDWRIGVALVTGLAAKEVVVSTMGTIYSLGKSGESSSELKTILKNDPAFSKATALSLMVFVLLYIPCVAAVGVMRKEIGNWQAVVLYSAYAMTVAWIFSFITYRLAQLLV